MKKGFTLIELMVVILIIGIIGAGAVVSFTDIDHETSKKELINKYKSIQRSANVFLDLNDSWLAQFNDKEEIFIKLSELKNSNFVNQDLTNPVTGEEIDASYSVKVFIDTDEDTGKKFINTCIVNDSGSETVCIADRNGNSPCNYNDKCK